MRTGAKRGFTLTEMLAVIGIMLVLMVATFGMFGTFAEQIGPDTAIATIQAVLNGARDYAATYGVVTQVVFTADSSKPQDGTSMSLQYYDPSGVAQDVRGRRPVALHGQLFVCKDMPTNTFTETTFANPTSPTEAELRTAAQRREQFLNGAANSLKSWASLDSNGVVGGDHKRFYVVFDPAGYLSQNPPSGVAGNTPQYGFTIIQVRANAVNAYAFYPLNMNSGTRLIFE